MLVIPSTSRYSHSKNAVMCSNEGLSTWIGCPGSISSSFINKTPASSSWACMSLKICPGPSTNTITKKVHQFLYFLRRLRIFSMSMNALISLLRVYGREHSDRLHHIKFRNSYTQECRSSRVVSITIAGIEWPNHGSELQPELPQKDSWYPHLHGHSHQQGVQLPKCLDHQIQE